jgi:hypothetical protein
MFGPKTLKKKEEKKKKKKKKRASLALYYIVLHVISENDTHTWYHRITLYIVWL